MTATDVRTIIKGVVEAHATHNNWYSVWSLAKDRESELTFPCVLWDQWQSRLAPEPGAVDDSLRRTQLVRLLIITTVPTDRTPAERDAAVEEAEQAATDIVLKLRDDYSDIEFGNIVITTLFDEYTTLDTGVLLSFSVKGEGLCLDQDAFNPPTDCPTFSELILDETWSSISSAMTPEQLAEAEADLAPACTPLGYDLHNTEDTVLLSGNVTEPCGATLELTAPDATVQLVDGKGSNIGEPALFPSGTSGQMTAPSVLVQLVSSDSEPLGEEQTIHSGSALTTIVAPDATVQLKDSAGDDIGGADNYLSGSTNTKTAPDGTVTIKNAGGITMGTQGVKSNGAADYIAPIPLKFAWNAGDGNTLTWTVTSDEAGTYTTYSSDGSSGTITFNKNGAGFAAVTGSIALAVSDTIIVRRTITTSAGYSKWVP